MNDSILVTIKKMLGLDADYDAFDQDITIMINEAFMVLAQLGVGDREGFAITGLDETWSQFLGDFTSVYESVKTYIYLKVRLIFDPPASSAVITSYENRIAMLEWRLNIEAERRERNAE